MGFIPRNKQSISHRKCRPMICGEIVEIVHTPCQSRTDMSNDLSFKFFLGLKFMERKGFPQSAGFDRNAWSYDFDLFSSKACWSTCMMTRADWDASLGEIVDAHGLVLAMVLRRDFGRITWWLRGNRSRSGRVKRGRSVSDADWGNTLLGEVNSVVWRYVWEGAVRYLSWFTSTHHITSNHIQSHQTVTSHDRHLSENKGPLNRITTLYFRESFYALISNNKR